MDASLTAALGLGFLLGLRHALDADHVAAVTTLLSRQRGFARSCLLGTFWGAGHTAALFGAAAVVMGFKLTISPGVERGLEMIVAVVLMLLGGHVLLRSIAALALRGDAHAHEGGIVHSHRPFAWGGRPFLIGLMHGMAGSAGLMLLVLGTIPSLTGGLLYVLVFGIGSTAGMLLLSGLISIPFALAAGRWVTAHALLQGLAGAVSLTLGAVLALEGA